jgi:hypothetical protein
MDSEGSSEPRRGITFWVILFLVLLLIGYPLSVGPVVALYSPNYQTPKWIDQAYKPIETRTTTSQQFALSTTGISRFGAFVSVRSI